MNRDNQISNEAILNLYQQGISQRAIGKQLGLSQPAVRKRLIKILGPYFPFTMAGIPHPDTQAVITCPSCGGRKIWACVHGNYWCSVCTPPKLPELEV